MTAKPPIFIELCAGTAALSLRLQGGPKAKPPVSRMGAKTGYADAILAVLGLYPGQGAESYLWCEPDDGVRGLLMAYPQPEVLRAAAKILRGWKDEEPRALWERLRAELKAGAAVEGAEGVARTVVLWGMSIRNIGPDAEPDIGKMQGMPETETWGAIIPLWDPLAGRLNRNAGMKLPPTFIARDGRAVTPEEVARYAFVAARTMPQAAGRGEISAGDFLQRIKADGTQRYPEDHPAGVLDGMPPFPPVTIVADGRVVTPEEVARFVQLLGANRLIPGTIADDGRWVNAARDGGLQTDGGVSFGGEEFATSAGANADSIARAAAMKWPPITLAADARTLTPPRLPEGVVCYMDPPYLDTTGYKHDLPRSEVVRMARLWADAGATVCISEAEPIPELIANGWHAVEISATRKGATRTFTGQQKMAKKKQPAEWLTLSRPPSFVPRAPEVFIEAPIVEVVKPARVKAAPVEVVAAEPQEVRQVDLFGGDR